MDRHILVTIDDSEQALTALEFAFTDYPDCEITVIHVLEPSDLAAYGGMEGTMMANFEEIHEQRQEQAEQLLAEAKEQADEHDITVSTELQTGDVERTLIEYVEDHEIDQIVIGSHGRSGVSRILLGSIAETVARRSPVPVTIVR